EFLAYLLRAVFHEAVETGEDVYQAGLRILPQGDAVLPLWEETLPGWAMPFVMDEHAPLAEVKYLLTFRPYPKLPAPVKAAYAGGSLHLLPSPGSLVGFGVQRILELHEELPLALQAPLLQAVARHRSPHGLHVPQSGLLHEGDGHAGKVDQEKVKNTY